VDAPVSLEQAWSAAPPPAPALRPETLARLPPSARLYLAHALPPGAPLPRAARLRSHGAIKLKHWWPFTAEQVIVWGRGFLWHAAVRMYGLPVRGGDWLWDGAGGMRWRWLGLLPLVNAAGPDLARSAAGRLHLESLWLPSALASDAVQWTEPAPGQLRARLAAHGEATELAFALAPNGGLRSVIAPRWGNPGGGPFAYLPFGALVEAEACFDGFTLPSRLRAGWHCGTDRFAQGEFFRVTLDAARFR